MKEYVPNHGRVSQFLARTLDGRLVSAYQAKKYRLTALVCPICEMPVTRVTEYKRTRTHFHHISCLCEGPRHVGAETLQHFMAKAHILGSGCAYLPASLSMNGNSNSTCGTLVLTKFIDPEVEPTVGKYRPDLLVRVGERPVAIEIKCSSGCTAEKLQALRQMGISVVEADLSAFAGRTSSQLQRALNSEGTWRCRIDFVWHELRRLQIRQEMMRSDLEIQQFNAAAARPKSEVVQCYERSATPTRFTGIYLRDPTETSYFTVSPTVWQAVILDLFFERVGASVSLRSIMQALVDHGTIASEHVAPSVMSLRRMRHDDDLRPEQWHGAYPLADHCSSFGEQVVHQFLTWLAEQELLRADPPNAPLAYSDNWLMSAGTLETDIH